MKVTLAGTESATFLINAYLSGCKTMLASYYHLFYVNNINSSPVRDWINIYSQIKNEVNYIMDSGLFTMMFGAGRGGSYDYKYLMDYTDKYISTMKKIGFKGYIVEADVHKLLGMEKLQDFRKKFCDDWSKEKTIFVFHVEEGFDNWVKLATDYDYIAISVPELRIVYKGDKNKIGRLIKKMVYHANIVNPNIKIHLLGCTEPKFMMMKGYTTADSSTWIFPGKVGRIIKLSNNFTGFESFDCDNRILDHSKIQSFEEFTLKAKINIKRFDYQKSFNSKYNFVNYISAVEMMKLNKYINKKYYPGERVEDLIV